MEKKDYWIYENKIIFKPNFNAKLDDFIDIITKCNELIFSDYNDYNITIKTNNKYYEEYEQNYKLSKFNKSVIIPKNVTHLTLGHKFNQQVIIPQSITNLTFGNKFDKQVIIPQSITNLTFGQDFNQPVIIPHNVIHLTFDDKFNQQITIPQNVTHLFFGENFNQQIIIPQNVTHLTFGLKFNQQIIIPENVTHLTFGEWFNQQVIIPQNVTHLTFGTCFNQQVIIPPSVTHLTFGYCFNKQINLPNIKYIKLDCDNIDLIENLPNSVEEIEFGKYFSLELYNLPNSIKKISFDLNSKYDKELNCLSEFVEYIKLPNNYNKKIKKFPLNLKTIECNKNYKYIDDFKDKFDIVFL